MSVCEGKHKVSFKFSTLIIVNVRIAVSAPSNTWACGRSLAGMAGSKQAKGMNFFLLCVVFCQVQLSASG